MNRVFVISNVFIISLFVLILQFKQESENILNIISELFIADFGKIYLIGVAFIVFSFIILGASKFGRVKLGGDDAKPEYSRFSWLSMLFSAGMGIGLIYWGVAEPLTHFVNPPRYETLSINAAKDAIQISYFHWGIHAWAIYGLLALLMAYYTYNHKMPLSLRSLLFPILGKNVNGPLCAGLDIFVIIVTVIGISTSLAMGATQIESGIAYLLPDISAHINAVHIVIFIAIASSISALTGISKGISYLSNINIALSFILIVVCLMLSREDSFFISFFRSIFDYIIVQIPTSFYDVTLSSYEDNWKGRWTIFYWAWWLSWSPTVSIFIARISKGRTVREFVMFVLLVPTLFSFLWFSAFGGMLVNDLGGKNSADMNFPLYADVNTMLFYFFEWLELPTGIGFLSLLVIMMFFITSADSGSLVLSDISSRSVRSPAWMKVNWNLILCLLACVLISGSSSSSMQLLSILFSMPLLIFYIMAILSLFYFLFSYRTAKRRCIT